MGATSVTGVGQKSADTQNKGAAPSTGYQTLGNSHIIGMPPFGIPFTEYPADGNWNQLFITAGDMQIFSNFFVAIQSFPFYFSTERRIESATITSENIIAVVDEFGVIAGITFSDYSNAHNAPYIYRGINVNTFPLTVGGATIMWEWNGMIFNLFVSVN